MYAGRPCRLVAEPDLAESICEAVRDVFFIDTAAALCGVSKQSVYSWFKRGEQEFLRHEQGKPPKGENAETFAAFFAALSLALAESERDQVHIVKSLVKGWQAAAWLLERRMFNKYGMFDRKKEAELLEQLKEIEANATRRSRKTPKKTPKKTENEGDA